MALIKGTPVVLYERVKVGEDDFHAPVYEIRKETVGNVLVSPISTADIESSIQIYGKAGSYMLGIPKGDEHNWEDAEVEFFGRKWRTFGMLIQGVSGNIPLDWHAKIQVERYE